MKNFTSFQSINEVKRAVKTIIAPFNTRVWTLIAPMLFVAFGLFGVNEAAWGNTWTANVGVGSGKGSAVAKINSDALVGGGVQKTSDAATSTTTKQAKWSSISSLTKGHAIFEATASAGYSFDAWYTNTACTSGKATGNPYSTASNKGGTYTYYAKFTPIQYKITFSKQNGTGGTESATVNFDNNNFSVITVAAPTRAGYTFGGYYTATGGGGVMIVNASGVWQKSKTGYLDANGKWIKAENTTVYAKWTANTYYVSFNGNGATSGEMSNQEFTYDADQKALTTNAYGRQYIVSYKANGGATEALQSSNTTATYAFVNWNTEADGSGTAYGNNQKVSNIATEGTLNLYAQWNSNSVVLPNATKTGGVLDAWYLGNVDVEANRIGAAGDFYTPTANVELTAKWIDKYTPEFGGSDQNMEVGDTRTGVFTFNHTDHPTPHISNPAVVSYNASTGELKALSAGTATIHFTQAGTTEILPGTSDTWTITVSRKANTLALTSTSATRDVDEEVTGIITTNNSDAVIRTSSSDESIAYYDVENKKIVIPNSEAKSFTTTTVTIKIWQEQTVKYEASDELTFTLTVNKLPASFTGSDYNLMVDGTQVANYVYTNTSADQPTANSADNFYYTIDEESLSTSVNKGSNVVTFNPANKQITACNAGTAKITLHQKETYKHTGATQSFNVAVHKYNSVFAGTSTVNVKVEANATSPYTLSYVKPNNSYISTESVTEGTPTANSNDDYYYTISHNVTTTNTTGSADAAKVIDYVAGEKKATGKNAGTATVHLYQTETYKFNAADASFGVNVTKNENTIYVKGNANYSSSIYTDSYDNGLAITATNTDYAKYPIQVTQTAGADVATYYPAQNAVYSTNKYGTATWSLYQPENYKYEAANGSFTVKVVQQTENTCYVLNESSGSDTQMDEATWSYDGPGAVLSYKIKRLTNLTYGDVTVYGYDANNNRTTLNTHSSTSLPTSYGNPISVAVGENIRKIEFYTGSYKNTKYVRDVKVTRKTYLNASDLTVDKKSNNTPVYPGEKGVGTLKIDYSLANGGNLKIANDNSSKFTLSQTEISASDCNDGSANIAIEYTSATAGTDYAHLVIYNNVYRKEVTITGKTVKQTPTITWSSDAEYFNVDDVLSATNANELTVTLSGNTDYVHCDGNTATMLAATSGKITITAHVAGNDIYESKDFYKEITITNKTKQSISWENGDFSRLKTTDANKTITLDATASSHLPVSYKLEGDKTGLTLTKNEQTGVWTLTYSASECKNTTIVAMQEGDEEYAPAPNFSLPVKVIDPTKICDTDETLVNSTVNLENTSTTYNIDIPSTMSIDVSRAKTEWYNVYLNGFKVELYSGRSGTGSKLHEYSYGADQINNAKTISLSGLNVAAKSVKLISEATNGYKVTSVTYTKQKYCNLSTSSLNFNTNPNTQTAALTVNVNYANYPISVECSNDKFSFSPAEFGDCADYGTQAVSVSYTAGSDKDSDVGYLYIKDNTGATLQTCTLNVAINKVAQSITNTNIQNGYLTTDKVTLTAEANSGLTDFTYSASPAGVASFDGAEMTFAKNGTIAITVSQAGTKVYNSTSKTVENVVVSKATPDIATNPTGTSVVYNQTLNKSTLSGGAAETTLRGVAHTEVAGSFAWTNPTQKITDNAGEHSYSVTFTPADGDMYNPKEFTIPIIVTRAEQSIAMNNGSVKVAVEGSDAGAADSKIDLDNLIQSQTSEVVNEAERAGSISYEVVSDNKGNATIGVGNIFSATAIGEYTIRATKAETDYYSQATADFTVTVGKRANTLAISGTEYERFIDEEVTAIRSSQNSDAQVQTSSSDATIAYYDVDNNKIVIPNNGTPEQQLFGSHKTVTITIWQEATERFEASGVKTITLLVKKHVTTITGTDQILKVNGTKTADYAFANTSTPLPSSNLSADFYYTIDEPNFENAALNNGTALITFNSNSNEIIGHNAGTTKITFFQKETREYTGATLMCNIAVEKKGNTISNTWNTWQKSLDKGVSATVSFTSTHGDYANYPIAIERVYGEEVASLGGNASSATITTNTTQGYAIWHLSQAENYEYYSAEADLTVMVGVPAPPTCYVYEDNSEHTFSTEITDAEGKYETPIAINSPIDKIWFSAKKSSIVAVNNFVVQYSMDNAKTWNTVSSPDLGTSYGDFSAIFPTMTEGKKITHVRFGAKTGATFSKSYKNVKISRRAYLHIQDAEQKNISSLPTMVCTIDETSTATAKFYIDYSTCADEIIIESSNPEHFTVSRTLINIAGNCDDFNTEKEEITVTYSSAELGTHSGVITVRTSYQTCVLSVSGETTKRTPIITWQDGYTNNPLTLPIGLTVNVAKPAAVSSNEAAIIYESSNENVVQIIENGYGFKVIGLGSATLTATSPENDKWKEVSETRVIHASEKIVQEIVWDQNFPRFMQPGVDVIELDAKVYLHNLATEALTYSEERTQYISYSCPLNNGVVTVSGNQMTIENYGQVKVTASVGGNSDYEAAAPVTILVIVRQPSVGCETPLVYQSNSTIDMFEYNVDFSDYSNLTTQEMISEAILLNTANGKPDKLSFSYMGEEYKIGLLSFFGGYIKFEQRVGTDWVAVPNSRVQTVKNEWNTNANLHLDENANAIRIIRESGATGHHKLRDIQITRKQYLRATTNVINLGEVILGQETPATIGFEYSDIKGDLSARTINETTDVTIQNNGEIDLECGSFGHYDLPITFTPTQEGEWNGTVEVYDNIANLSITVALTATVVANEDYIFNKVGEWNNPSNWSTNLRPDADANVTVAQSVIVNSDASVNSITINAGVTVTVKEGVTLTIGDGTPKSELEVYGNLHVENGAKLILNTGTNMLHVNNFILDAALGDIADDGQRAGSGQVLHQEKIAIQANGNAYFDLTIDPDGQVTFGWYIFTIPFDVNINGGIYRLENNGVMTPLVCGRDFKIAYYDEALRATGEKGWLETRSGSLRAGTAYAITLDDDVTQNVIRFQWNKENSLGGSYTCSMERSVGGDAKYLGWNGIGNGTLTHTQLDGMPSQAKIQIYDHTGKTYIAVEPKDYTYAIGTAFFYQAPNTEPVVLSQAEGTRTIRAPKYGVIETEEFRLSLRDENDRKADVLFFSASEEATDEYVIGHDLLKMGTPSEAKVAQMWATKGGSKLCDIETPLVGNDGYAPLSFFAPKEGEYTIAIEAMPEDAKLYLTYNEQVIWNLSASPYTIGLTQGTTEGYGLRIKRAPQSTTDLDEMGDDSKSVRKVIINDMLYIITPEGAIYNIIGKNIK